MAANKNIRTLILLSFWVLTLNSCSSNYQVIDRIQSHHNIEKGNIILSNKGFNPSKKIFARLDKVLSDDFIYIFSWVNHLPMVSNHFTALIYDRESKRTFYINNTLENERLIEIKEESTNHQEEKIILDYYFNNKINTLVSLTPTFDLASQFSLFDSKTEEAYVVENLELDKNSEILGLSDDK